MTEIVLSNNEEKTLVLNKNEVYKIKNVKLIQNTTHTIANDIDVKISKKEITNENKGFLFRYGELAQVDSDIYLLSKKYFLTVQVSNL